MVRRLVRRYFGCPWAPLNSCRFSSPSLFSISLAAHHKRGAQYRRQPKKQEKEFEVTNEYIFALGSHVIYWSSKDVSLFVAQQVVADAIADADADAEEDGVGATSGAIPREQTAAKAGAGTGTFGMAEYIRTHKSSGKTPLVD